MVNLCKQYKGSSRSKILKFCFQNIIRQEGWIPIFLSKLKNKSCYKFLAQKYIVTIPNSFQDSAKNIIMCLVSFLGNILFTVWKVLWMVEYYFPPVCLGRRKNPIKSIFNKIQSSYYRNTHYCVKMTTLPEQAISLSCLTTCRCSLFQLF